MNASVRQGGWSQDELAAKYGVSKPPVVRLETTDGELGGYAGAGDKMVDALESAGVTFV
jgi:predicted transcriptional regulator